MRLLNTVNKYLANLVWSLACPTRPRCAATLSNLSSGTSSCSCVIHSKMSPACSVVSSTQEVRHFDLTVRELHAIRAVEAVKHHLLAERELLPPALVWGLPADAVQLTVMQRVIFLSLPIFTVLNSGLFIWTTLNSVSCFLVFPRPRLERQSQCVNFRSWSSECVLDDFRGISRFCYL